MRGAMPSIDVSASEAVEQQLVATNFMAGLVADPVLGRRCLAEYATHPDEPLGRKQMPPDLLARKARDIWIPLAGDILQAAVPFHWTPEAIHRLDRLCGSVVPNTVLSPELVPAPAGWWWFGHPPVLPGVPTALGFSTDDAGAVYFPFHTIFRRWRIDWGFKGQWFQLGPMTSAAYEVDYGASVATVSRKWAHLPPENRGILDRQLQVFIAACTGIARGELVVETQSVDASEHARLQADFPRLPVPEEVRVVRLGHA